MAPAHAPAMIMEKMQSAPQPYDASAQSTLTELPALRARDQAPSLQVSRPVDVYVFTVLTGLAAATARPTGRTGPLHSPWYMASRCYYTQDYAVVYLDREFTNSTFALGLKEDFFGSADLQTAGAQCFAPMLASQLDLLVACIHQI